MAFKDFFKQFGGAAKTVGRVLAPGATQKIADVNEFIKQGPTADIDQFAKQIPDEEPAEVVPSEEVLGLRPYLERAEREIAELDFQQTDLVQKIARNATAFGRDQDMRGLPAKFAGQELVAPPDRGFLHEIPVRRRVLSSKQKEQIIADKQLYHNDPAAYAAKHGFVYNPKTQGFDAAEEDKKAAVNRGLFNVYDTYDPIQGIYDTGEALQGARVGTRAATVGMVRDIFLGTALVAVDQWQEMAKNVSSFLGVKRDEKDLAKQAEGIRKPIENAMAEFDKIEQGFYSEADTEIAKEAAKLGGGIASITAILGAARFGNFNSMLGLLALGEGAGGYRDALAQTGDKSVSALNAAGKGLATYFLNKLGAEALISKFIKAPVGATIGQKVVQGIFPEVATEEAELFVNAGIDNIMLDKAMPTLQEYWDTAWTTTIVTGGVGAFSSIKLPQAQKAWDKAKSALRGKGFSPEQAEVALQGFSVAAEKETKALVDTINGSFFGESRMAGLQGITPSNIRPGIEAPAPLPDARLTKFEGENFRTEDSVARAKYDIDKLPVVSKGGSDRLVFGLGDNKVLKVAKTARGLSQNDLEGDGLVAGGVLPEIYESGKNYVVVEEVDFKTDRKKINELTKFLASKDVFFRPGELDGGKLWEALAEAEEKFGVEGLVDLANYDLLWNDITAARNWGVSAVDGRIVHADGGSLSKSVLKVDDALKAEFDEIKAENKALQSKFADMSATEKAPVKSKFAFKDGLPQDGRPGIEKSAPLPVAEDLKLKTAREFKGVSQKVGEISGEIEAIDERLKGFVREELALLRKVHRMLEKTDGDIETLRASRPRLVNNALEKVEEVLGLDETGALDFIENIPSRGQVKALRSERNLTLKRVAELKRKIDRMQVIRNLKDKQKKAQEIKGAIIEHAKSLPLRERGKLLTTVKNAKTDLDFKKAVDKVAELQEFSKKKSLTAKIEKEMKSLKPKKRGAVPRGKLTAGTQELVDSISARLDGNRAEALKKLEQNITEYADKPVPKEVFLENVLLSVTGVKDMDSSDLRRTLNIIKSVKEKGQIAAALKKTNEDGEIETVVEAAIDEFSGGEGVKYGGDVGVKLEKQFNPVTGTVDVMNNAMLGYRNVVEKLSKKAKTSAVKNWTVKAVHEARKKNTRLTREWRQNRIGKYAEIMGAESNRQLKKVLEKQGEQKVVFEGKDSSGKKVKLEYSELEAADLYMKMQDPSLRPTFEKTMKYTPEMFQAVEDAVSEDLKEYAEWLVAEHYPSIKRSMAPVYEDKFGIKMPNNPFYSPLKRFGVDLGEDTDLLTGDVFPGKPTTTPTSAKSRTGSLLPIEANNIMKVAARHELQVGQFVAFDKAVSQLRRVFGNKELKETIIQQHGKNLYNRLSKTIDDIARGSIDSRLSVQVVDKAITNFTKASLMLNFVPLVKQLTSYPAFLAQMPAKDLAAGTAEFAKSPVKWTKKLMESETFYDRVTRGFDKDTALALKSGREKVRVNNEEVTLKSFILNSLIMPTRGGDMIPILPGATAKYLHSIKEGKSEEQALVEAELMVLETQQSPHIEDLSHFQTSGSFLKLMSMYQTTPIQYYRQSVEAVRNAHYGRESKAQAAKKIGIYWIVLPALFQLAANGFEWDSKDQLRSVLFGPLNYYPAVGNLLQTIYGIAQGEWWRDVASDVSPMFSLLDKSVGGLGKFAKGVMEQDQEDIIDAAKDLAGATLQILGKPEAGPRRTFDGLVDLATGETDDLRRLMWSEYALGEEDTGTSLPDADSDDDDLFFEDLDLGGDDDLFFEDLDLGSGDDDLFS